MIVMETDTRFGAFDRQRYLRMHEGDERFPLDGSNWARLVAMRLLLRRDNFRRFLAILHSDNSPLYRERKAFQRGINHWFVGANRYEVPYRFSSVDANDDPVWRHMVHTMVDNEESKLAALSQRHRFSNSSWASSDRSAWADAL